MPKSQPRARTAVVHLPARSGRRAELAHLLPSGRSVAGGLLLLALAVGAYVGARATSAFEVTRVEVKGAPPPIAREVRQALRPLVGTSLLDVGGRHVEARVESIPSVATATYDRAFPHTLVVFVRPERPVAILRRGSDSWLVAASGRVLVRVARGARARLPRVWIPKSVEVGMGLTVADPSAERALRALEGVSPRTFPARVRTVRAGEGERTFLLASGLEVRLGDESDLRLKLAVASRVIPLLPHRSSGGPTYLDVSLPARPVAGTTLNSEVEVDTRTAETGANMR